jgi:putative tryptophan/tyrosine transport system substrate-binding protein
MAIHIRRREFMVALGGALAVWPVAARAQQGERMRRIGVLMSFAESDASARSMVEGFRSALAQVGWIEGKNLQMEVRWAAGNADRIKTFATELVELRPDVILVQGTVSTGSVIRETQSIPIVFVHVADPIGSGFVASLAHPGKNVTGFMLDLAGQAGKWIELLKEIAPRTKQIALLSNPETGPSLQLFMPAIQAAALSFAIEVSVAPVHANEEIERVIAAMASNPGTGLVVTPAAFFTVNRDLITALAARYRLPAVYYERGFADSGGLIAYSPDYGEHLRGAAAYVDRIVKGAKPADLPVQINTRFELFVNVKTATALGLTVPQTLLASASEVIE